MGFRVAASSLRSPIVTSDSVHPSEPAPTAEVDHPSKPVDVLLIHGVTPDGEALQVLRQRQDRLEAGALRPIREGRPIVGELVRLRPRTDFPLLCDVEVELPAGKNGDDVAAARALQAAHKGPAQVATDTYRRNWDLIWKRPGEDSGLPN